MSTNREIFVFGSNLKGRHGKGTALHALQNYGALYGVGIGLQGESYAIPTRDANPIGSKYPGVRSLTLPQINKYVTDFLIFARDHPEMTFNVTPIGCGNAGFTPQQIAPMFLGYSDNVKLPESFLECLETFG